MDQNNTRSKVAQPNPPPQIESFRQSLKDLTGLDAHNANEVGAALQPLLTSEEVLAIFFLKACAAVQRAMARTLVRGDEKYPCSVWDAAGQVRSSAQCELVDKLTQLKLMQSPVPVWAHETPQSVKLREPCTYRLQSDERNVVPVVVTIGDKVELVEPGRLLAIKNTDAMELKASEPCRVHLTRVAGRVRTGDLRDCLPLPREVQKPKAVQPPASPKKRWFW